MKTTIPIWRSGRSVQEPVAKQAIRNWLLARSRTRLPLPDFEQLRADIETYAREGPSIDALPCCAVDSCKE